MLWYWFLRTLCIIIITTSLFSHCTVNVSFLLYYYFIFNYLLAASRLPNPTPSFGFSQFLLLCFRFFRRRGRQAFPNALSSRTLADRLASSHHKVRQKPFSDYNGTGLPKQNFQGDNLVSASIFINQKIYFNSRLCEFVRNRHLRNRTYALVLFIFDLASKRYGRGEGGGIIGWG